MDKTSSRLFYMILFSFWLLLTSAYATESTATGYQRQLQFSEIAGKYVMNPQGQFLGRIRDFAFDSEGHVSFAILSRPGVLGIPGKPIAVPFDALSYRDKEGHFVLNADYERIRDAPVFSKNDLADRKWAEETYRYFGQQPYWTE